MRRFLPRVERLESRIVLNGDVTVTPTSIITAFDTIPRFAAQAEYVAIQSGNWSDPSVWNLGTIPGSSAKVQIPHDIEVRYDTNSRQELDAIEVSGHLEFDPQVKTSLWLHELMVMPHGELSIGHELSPVRSDVSSEIVFVDTPNSGGLHYKTGTLQQPGIDLSQYGNGLIVFGKLTIHGSEKTPFARATGNITNGESTVQLDSTVAGWNKGDTILFPHTAQRANTRSTIAPLRETEVVALESSTDRSIKLATPLNNDHFGISENSFGIERYSHVANLTRNVVLRSENPTGVRGHFMALGSAEVRIKNAEFRSLGRTSADSPVANTLFNSNGSIFIIGTNQIGRYPIHLHHLENPFLLDGIVVNDARKWGIAIHDSDNGIVHKSIVYDADGAGIVTEDGSETGNMFLDNLIVKVDGGHQKFDGRAGAAETVNAKGDLFIETGADGSGFWMRSSEGVFRGNTVYDVASYAFNFNGYYRTPNRQFTYQQLDSFKHNEAVSSKGGLWFTWSQGQASIELYQRQKVSNFLAWHIHGEGVKSYHEAKLSFENVTIIGNPAVSNSNTGNTWHFDFWANSGFWFGIQNYENFDVRMSGIQVEGMNLGIVTPVEAGSEGITIDRATLGNYVNIAMPRLSQASKVQYTNITYLPSRVSRVGTALPDAVADVWHEELGIIKPGVLSPSVPPGVPDKLPVQFDLRKSDGRLTITSLEASDSVALDEVGSQIAVTINKRTFNILRADVTSIIFWGYGGNDTFLNNTSVTLLAFGGDGNDVLKGGSANDSLYGGEGNDTVDGMGGKDYIDGGHGQNTITGGDGDDKIYGGANNDIIRGGNGADVIFGGGGDNEIYGDSGDDLLFSDAGNDQVFGGDGNDGLYTGGGADRVFGGGGDDYLDAGAGDDYLDGEDGRDKLYGGLGDDILVYELIDWIVEGGSGNNILRRR